MNDTTRQRRQQVVERVLTGPGVSSPADRRAAFDNAAVDPRAQVLVDTIARTAWKVTDGQVRSTIAAGLAEDAVFELAVSAALGQATRQRVSAAAAVDEVFGPTEGDGR
jgi:hypothetical protein